MNHTTNPIDVKIWFNSGGLKSISPVLSSTCVRRSRGDFDHFLGIIHDFLASMDTELSLRSKRITKNL